MHVTVCCVCVCMMHRVVCVCNVRVTVRVCARVQNDDVSEYACVIVRVFHCYARASYARSSDIVCARWARGANV